MRQKKELHIGIQEVLFILIASWIYTLLTYYLPFGSTHSLCEIYTFQGIPFALFLGLIGDWKNKKDNNEKKP